jgi:PLD-like domain
MGSGRVARGELRTFARPELLRRVGEAKVSVWLASPFISHPIAEELARANSTAGLQRRLLTALVAGSVRVRALDPHALTLLSKAGWEIRSIRNLHAKLSLIDSRWGLVGSGNLTNAGLGSTAKGNVELGVVLNPAQIAAAAAIYEDWWDEAKPVTEVEIERFAAIPPAQKGGAPEEGVGPALEIADPADLKTILGADDPTRRYWVKANYHKRRTDGRGWWHRNWISDWRRASYRKGDLILLYLGAEYDGPRRCPAVVRVTREAQREPEFVARADGDPEAAKRWPYVTRIECVFEVPVESGVPLNAFGVTAQGLQGGYKTLSKAQFETAISHLLNAAEEGR